MKHESALVLTDHEWRLLAAVAEFYLDEASEHAHAGRALCERILEAAR